MAKTVTSKQTQDNFLRAIAGLTSDVGGRHAHTEESEFFPSPLPPPPQYRRKGMLLARGTPRRQVWTNGIEVFGDPDMAIFWYFGRLWPVSSHNLTEHCASSVPYTQIGNKTQEKKEKETSKTQTP